MSFTFPAGYPGFYATPGAAWPGATWIGQPGPERFPVTIAYIGGDQRCYPGYRDLGTGSTLNVTPGSAYTFMAVGWSLAASQGTPAVPNDGRWTGPPGSWTL